MKPFFCCTFFFSVSWLGLFSQESIKIEHSCNYYEEVAEHSYFQFAPSEEIYGIIRQIIEKTGIRSVESYVIKEANVSNALATFVNGQRYILYNSVFLEKIQSSTNAKWAAYSILAHELGHHILHHPFGAISDQQRKELELEADMFSGEALRALGATLDEALSGIRQMPDSAPQNSNYPSRRAREAAIANGWKGRDEIEKDTLFQLRINQVVKELEEKMVLVRGGIYSSQPGNDQRIEVQIPDFFIGKHEVTQREWTAVMGRNPSFFNDCPNCPVERVSWNDIQIFLRRLNQRTGSNYRLPTEMEWEFACKGGNTSETVVDSALAKAAFFIENSKGRPSPVGLLRPNSFGLYDMLGNVAEWCDDWYYPDRAGENSQSGIYKVIRGGSWLDGKAYLSPTFRARHLPGVSMPKYGFRLCRSPG